MIRFLTFLVACLPIASAQVTGIADPCSKFPKDQTVVWCPIFQATWDQMDRAMMNDKPLKVESASPLMKRLDSFRWDADSVMPKNGWKTWAGPATQEFLDQVNREAAKMTGDKEPVFDLKFKNPNNLGCFGLLHRNLEFMVPFFRSRREPLLFGSEKEPVQFFGVRSEAAANYDATVRVLSYRPGSNSHAVELACRGTDETVILYMPSEPQDFATACRWVKHWRINHDSEKGKAGQWNDGQLHEDDDLRIPYVTLDVRSDYTDQLSGARYYGNNPWYVASARQHTKFKLHEKGARVTSAAVIELTPFGGAYQRTYPRKFIYDQPFFAFLWREKADWPYLGVWVGDSSALVPMK